jgi:hypothetical protein
VESPRPASNHAHQRATTPTRERFAAANPIVCVACRADSERDHWTPRSPTHCGQTRRSGQTGDGGHQWAAFMQIRSRLPVDRRRAHHSSPMRSASAAATPGGSRRCASATEASDDPFSSSGLPRRARFIGGTPIAPVAVDGRACAGPVRSEADPGVPLRLMTSKTRLRSWSVPADAPDWGARSDRMDECAAGRW